MTQHHTTLQAAAMDAAAQLRENARKQRLAAYYARQETLDAIRPCMGQMPMIDRMRGELERSRWAMNSLTDRLHPLNTLVRKHSAFADMHALVSATGYRPTLNMVSIERECIADAYDAIQVVKGDDRRAYRSGRCPTNPQPAASWTEAGQVTNARTNEKRVVWFGVVHDHRLTGIAATRYVGYWEDEGIANMQAAGAAARINKKAATVAKVAYAQVEAGAMGMTVEEYVEAAR